MGLSDKERNLIGPKPKLQVTRADKKQKQARPAPEVRLISWTNTSEWKCPFCARISRNNATRCEGGKKGGKGCASVFKHERGNVQFAYRTSDGRPADTAMLDAMKQEVIKFLSE